MRKQNLFKLSISLLLIISLLMTFTACSTNKKNNNKANKSQQTKKNNESKKKAKKKVKILILTAGSVKDTYGDTYNHVQGIKKMAKNLKLKDDQILFKDKLNTSVHSQGIVKSTMVDAIADGFNVIIATDDAFKYPMSELAENYPDVTFSHCSGEYCNARNFNNYYGKIHQPFYLAGIAAGLKTKTNRIGFVSSWGKNVALSAFKLNAFAMGVSSVNPKAKVFSYKINGYLNNKAETFAANYLVKLKADVLAQDTYSTAPQLVAQKNKIWSIGYNTDMSKVAPDSVLLSVVWNWDVYYTDLINDIINNKWTGKNYFGSMKDGVVGITDLAKFNADGTDKKIKAAQKQFEDDSYDIYSGVITTNEKTTVGTEGKLMDTYTLLYKSFWLYNNIVEVPLAKK